MKRKPCPCGTPYPCPFCHAEPIQLSARELTEGERCVLPKTPVRETDDDIQPFTRTTH